MKKNKIEMKTECLNIVRYAKYVMISMMIISAIMTVSGCVDPIINKENNTLNISENDPPMFLFVCDVKCGCDEIIFEPDFCGNIILVSMSRELSEQNKIHEKSFFGDIEIINIRDLTLDIPVVHQILALTLNKNCKSNVLKVITSLNEIEGIMMAEPNYHLIPTGE